MDKKGNAKHICMWPGNMHILKQTLKSLSQHTHREYSTSLVPPGAYKKVIAFFPVQALTSPTHLLTVLRSVFCCLICTKNQSIGRKS